MKCLIKNVSRNSNCLNSNFQLFFILEISIYINYKYITFSVTRRGLRNTRGIFHCFVPSKVSGEKIFKENFFYWKLGQVPRMFGESKIFLRNLPLKSLCRSDFSFYYYYYYLVVFHQGVFLFVCFPPGTSSGRNQLGH